MSKFKIGDWVRIKISEKDLVIKYGRLAYGGEMLAAIGKIGKIVNKDLIFECLGHDYFDVMIDGNVYSLEDCDLEPLQIRLKFNKGDEQK